MLAALTGVISPRSTSPRARAGVWLSFSDVALTGVKPSRPDWRGLYGLAGPAGGHVLAASIGMDAAAFGGSGCGAQGELALEVGEHR